MTNEFLSDLFEGQEGIVYAPTMERGVERKDDKWRQSFFEWPIQRNELESHLDDFKKRDVYLSPVLFNEKRISPETFKGTNYLWTEFDGVTPKEVIEPSMRIMSSQAGHEHWYWRLNEFITDKVIVEDLTRRIAYHYGADLSVWDYQNVLRPPATWNHKRNLPVTLLGKNSKFYTVNNFTNIPIPAAGTRVDIRLGDLPPKEFIFAKYKWKPDTLDLLFKPEVAVGKRSDAMIRLAYDLVEAGCSNEESYVLLESRDTTWGKYVGRNDREKRLQDFISRARSNLANKAELVNEATEVYRFHDFMRTTIKMRWAIEGLLPVAGSMVIFGKPGVGKSTFSLRVAMSLALGEEKFLNWKIVHRQRTLFVSLEMPHDELKSFFEDMKMTEDMQAELQEWFHIWPIGHAFPFDKLEQQLELLKYIDQFKIELVIIDSLGLSMYGSINDDDDVKRLNSFLNEDVRKDRKCGYMFIHHPRKEGMETNRKKTLDDLFGSGYIAANAQTVVYLGQKSGSVKLHVEMLKTRLSLEEQEFDIERTPDRGFKIAGTVSTPAIEQRETSGDKKPENGSLGKLFSL
jgi:KaiC/GvpD/RAD55 family RecA-like ATPase